MISAEIMILHIHILIKLLGSDNQLRIANNKVDEVSIKKLTRGNKTMQEKFEELKKNQ